MNAQILESTGEVTRKQNLFEIGDELEQIFQAYESIEDPEAAKAVEAYFEKIADNLDAKIDAYCGLIKSFEAKAAIRANEAKRLQGLAKTDENNAKQLKARLKKWFEDSGNQKIETKFHKLWTQGNGGVAPLKWIRMFEGSQHETEVEPTPEEVGERFTKPVIDTDKIREALEAGEELAFAKLGSRGTSLRIK